MNISDLNLILGDGPVSMAEQGGHIQALQARISRDDFFASRFATLMESASSDPMSKMMLSMVVLSGGVMADQLVQFKRPKAARKISDPWSNAWIKSAKASLAEKIAEVAPDFAIEVLKGLALGRDDEGAIPSSGLPAEIIDHLDDHASEPTDATRTQLLVDFFHSQSSHTVLLGSGIKLPAVDSKGSVLHIKDNKPALLGLSFGWRADACRPVKKKKVVASSDAAPSAEADAPFEE